MPSAVSEVRTAAMPQPMSTPTAAGIMALWVAMTLPMVAPMPPCTSGMTATWRWMKGNLDRLTSCPRAKASRSSVQTLTGRAPSMMTCLMGMIAS